MLLTWLNLCTNGFNGVKTIWIHLMKSIQRLNEFFIYFKINFVNYYRLIRILVVDLLCSLDHDDCVENSVKQLTDIIKINVNK